MNIQRNYSTNSTSFKGIILGENLKKDDEARLKIFEKREELKALSRKDQPDELDIAIEIDNYTSKRLCVGVQRKDRKFLPSGRQFVDSTSQGSITEMTPDFIFTTIKEFVDRVSPKPKEAGPEGSGSEDLQRFFDA